MLTRLVDFLKTQPDHALLTSLTARRRGAGSDATSASRRWSTPGCCCATSKLGGERNRGLYVLKSRGMAHSNQIREFVIRTDGASSCSTSTRGPEGVLTGSMRLAQEAREQAGGVARQQAARSAMRGTASASARCSRRASPRCARNSRPAECEAGVLERRGREPRGGDRGPARAMAAQPQRRDAGGGPRAGSKRKERR